MKPAYTFSLAAIFALGATSPILIGCEDESAVEELGDDINDGAEELGDDINEGIEEVEDEIDDATTD